ncbi:hypothetical protein [Alteromonas sp. RKMC-009]|uniref:hypothetical protein n=1 Tax=Alteromonas sp. RKMC-009 TaxID=2267264 RepID=UPI000E6793DE|nr:hypothetical protein [Alteromonas sp. RKMC-009]AYA64292.1 hypothetical protein DS731_09955 [Alteromonas sp. RKMC-009]
MSEQTAPATPLLDAIIRVMEIVVREDKAFRMYDFYEKRNKVAPETTIHTCGTAACICGYAALDMDVIGHVKVVGLGTPPRKIWACVEKELDSVCAADSMFDAYPEDRMDSANRTGWLHHLLDHPHLIRETPTAAEALDYLQKVKIAFNEVKYA